MDMPSGLLGAGWQWLGHLIFALVLGYAMRYAQWRRLADRQTLNVFLGTCVALMVVWSIKAGISPGMHFHYLGMTVLTLMFGWHLAVFAAALVLLGVTLNGGAGWEAYSVNALVMGVVPITVSWAILRTVETKLPNNYFVYVLGNAFFGGGLAVAASGLLVALLLALSGTYPVARIAYEYLPFFPLMMVPEAFLNGMVTAILVGFRPEWVLTFDDRRYIVGK